MKTPFYELAEKIAEDKISISIIENLPYEYILFYYEIFYETNLVLNIIFNSKLAITCLLFADLLWQDEMKGGKI